MIPARGKVGMSTGLKESVFILTLSPSGCVTLTLPSLGLGHLVCETKGFYQMIPKVPHMALPFISLPHLPAALSSGTSGLFYKRNLDRM